MLKGLYVIADLQYLDARDVLGNVEAVLSAGARIIQYRDKISNRETRTAIGHKLRLLTGSYQALLIVNDDVELAKTIHADGVHLGKDDRGISEAVSFLGADKIIGASCYNEFDNALRAAAEGAAYIAFGSFYTSPTKPSAPLADIGLIARAKQQMNIPVCAIGGITPENARPLLDAGADMIAVISGIFGTPSPAESVRRYLSLLQPFCAAP